MPRVDGQVILRGGNGKGSNGGNYKYDPATCCAAVVELMGKGCTRKELALQLGVTYVTLLNWADAHEEFAQALREGDEASIGWWDRQARINIYNPNFNNVLYIFMRANMHGFSRQDPMNIKMTGGLTHKNEQHVYHTLDLSKLSLEALETLRLARATVDEATAKRAGRPPIKPGRSLQSRNANSSRKQLTEGETA